MSFKFGFKDAIESFLTSLVGRSFQRVGAAFWNAPCQQVNSLFAGIFNKFVSAERVVCVVSAERVVCFIQQIT